MEPLLWLASRVTSTRPSPSMTKTTLPLLLSKRNNTKRRKIRTEKMPRRNLTTSRTNMTPSLLKFNTGPNKRRLPLRRKIGREMMLT